MNNLLLYLLKVSAGTTLMYLGYLLFFRKDTFYLRNRIFLILTLLIPVILPALKIPITSSSLIPVEPVKTIDSIVFPEAALQATLSGTVNSGFFDFNILIGWVYFAIMGLLLLRAIISLISTFRIIKKGVVKTSLFPKVIISENQLSPFSFFPFVVIPAEDYKSGNYKDILDHEFAHIRQRHTFDLLLSEIFIAFQWFNPFVWFIKRSIILNHEYLADQVSLSTNKSAKEYQYRLLSIHTELKNISLAHNFNSLIKNRIIMINKTPTHRYAALKNILILPIVAIAVYAFATPEYKSPSAPKSETSVILQKEIKGIVLSETGIPLEGANIVSTGAPGSTAAATTGPDGRFTLYPVREDAYLSFSCRGYKSLTVKAVLTSEMTVKLEKDPEYKNPAVILAYPKALVSVDGVFTDQDGGTLRKKMGDEIAKVSILTGKAATDKYGEKGKDGVWEFMTWKKANELGIKIPVRRIKPEDYPTFRGEGFFTFRDWVIRNIKYPAEARSKGIEGWIHVSYTVEADGSLSNIKYTGATNTILGDAVIKAVQSSPRWEPAKNPKATDPFTSELTLKFVLPDKVSNEEAYVMVEKMPEFPGGDDALLKYVYDQIQYPSAAEKENIQGRVILRFIVNSKGKVEDVAVLKGVDPLLDAEAIRVVRSLPDWIPATQGGIPTSVYYSIPVTFGLKAKSVSQGLIISKPLGPGIYKFLNENIIYPQEAKKSSDTGNIFVVVKLTKGGVVKECTAFTERAKIKVPLMDEVVIVGYGSSKGQSAANNKNAISNDHPALKNECLRVANKLSVNEVPEWKDNNMEFALAFKFVLK